MKGERLLRVALAATALTFAGCAVEKGNKESLSTAINTTVVPTSTPEPTPDLTPAAPEGFSWNPDDYKFKIIVDWGSHDNLNIFTNLDPVLVEKDGFFLEASNIYCPKLLLRNRAQRETRGNLGCTADFMSYYSINNGKKRVTITNNQEVDQEYSKDVRDYKWKVLVEIDGEDNVNLFTNDKPERSESGKIVKITNAYCPIITYQNQNEVNLNNGSQDDFRGEVGCTAEFMKTIIIAQDRRISVSDNQGIQ